jgi:hypothetical protein
MVLLILIIDNQPPSAGTSSTGASVAGPNSSGPSAKTGLHTPPTFSSLETIKAAAELFYQKFCKIAPMMLLESGDDRGHLLSYVGDPSAVIEDAIKNIEPCSSGSSNNRGSGNSSGGSGSGSGSGGCSVSSAISNALTIVNKYRIKNSTDHFGMGRMPWYVHMYICTCLLIFCGMLFNTVNHGNPVTECIYMYTITG